MKKLSKYTIIGLTLVFYFVASFTPIMIQKLETHSGHAPLFFTQKTSSYTQASPGWFYRKHLSSKPTFSWGADLNDVSYVISFEKIKRTLPVATTEFSTQSYIPTDCLRGPPLV